MNIPWFIISFIITLICIRKTSQSLAVLKKGKPESIVCLPTYKEEDVYFDNPKSFVNSKEFAQLSFDEREQVVKDYLFKQSKSIYNCLLYRNKSKCFTFNERESIYAKKRYREEDMTMRYPHQYNVLINNPNACSDSTYIVIGSPSGPRQFVERTATRETWGRIHDVDGKEVIHLFFIGQDPGDEENDSMLQEENAKYHDIIQFDMQNHFMNLTLLAILTYNWTATYCPHIAYYIRSDNDMWYNPRLHIHTFLMEPRSQTLIGNIVTGSKPIRVPQSRYWLPASIFPGKMFDPYPSGCFVTIAGDTLKTIVETSEKIGPILYFDDVFLGMIAREANLTLLTYPGNTLYFFNQAFNPSVYSRMSAAHRYAPVDLLALWQIASR